MRKAIIIAVLLPLAAAFLSAQSGPARRVGVFVGANDGGSGRVLLRYAVKDAQSVAEVFTSMGGVSKDDATLLVEPTKAQLEGAVAALKGRIGNSSGGRSEVVFYYSGHADSEGMLLKGERFPFRDLRRSVESLKADMKVVIIDACSSGAFTRAKGGTKTAPFLVDESANMKGYAFMTSSSADEVSQESDRIKGSFFTQYLVTGLRGAADTKGDGRVTITEAYQYAYAETLAGTEKTQGGAQHPNYDIQMAGAGDYVVTDVNAVSARLRFTADVSGRLFIRDQSKALVAELSKPAGKPTELALAPGRYAVTLDSSGSWMEASATVARDSVQLVSAKSFVRVEPERAVSRGGGDPAPDGVPTVARPDDPREAVATALDLAAEALRSDARSVARPETADAGFQISILPDFSDRTSAFHVGLLGHSCGELNGFGVSALGDFVTGNVSGFQGTGVVAVAGGNVSGTQLAGVAGFAGGSLDGFMASGTAGFVAGNVSGGFMNGVATWTGGKASGYQAGGVVSGFGSLDGFSMAGVVTYSAGNVSGATLAGVTNLALGDVSGAQIASVFNRASALDGVQIGLVNVADSVKGAQVGLVNVAFDNFHPTVSYSENGFWTVSLRGGNRHFHPETSLGWNPSTTVIAVGFGLGGAVDFGPFDAEIGLGSTYARDWSFARSMPFEHVGVLTGKVAIRLSLSDHFSLFAGLTGNWMYMDTSATPEVSTLLRGNVSPIAGRNDLWPGFVVGVSF